MSHGKRMDNRKRVLELVQKNRNGIKVDKIAEKLDIDPSTVYRQLDHLQHNIKLDRGIAFPIEHTPEKPGRFKFLKRLDRRSAEMRKKQLEEVEADSKWLAKTFPSMEPLRDWVREQKKSKRE